MTCTLVMPTVAARARDRALTVAQWEALGLRPTVVEQPATWPVGHDSQLVTAQRALTLGAASRPDQVIYSEDDIDIDPRVLDWCAPTDGTIVALWSRPRFAHSQAGLAPARQQSRWLSSLAFAATPKVAAELSDYQGKGGIDHAMRQHPARIVLPPRPMVEHRDLSRRASHGGGHITSGGDYQGPDSHRLARLLYEWLPGRRDKQRVTSPTVAAANLGMSAHEVAWLYPALEKMGCIIRDRRDQDNWHRGTPPYPTAPAPTTEEGLF